METIPDIESRIRFMVASNMWVNNHHSIFTDNQYIIERDNPAFEEMELRKRLVEIDKRECEITGFSFDELCYCRALISWHEKLRSNETSSKRVDRLKTLRSFKKSIKARISPSSFKPYITKQEYRSSVKTYIKENDYQRLLRFSEQLTRDEYIPCKEYFVAISYRRSHNNTIDSLLIINPEIRSLLVEKLNIRIKLSEKCEADPLFSPHLFCCPFCGKNKLTENIKTPKSCESPKCDASYFRANRHKNHPKRGWIYDPTAQQPCIGGCGSDRKQLNSNRVCFGCYETFS